MQMAIVSKLKADGGVIALVGQKIYDRVPSYAKEPYVSFGDCRVLSDDALCVEAYDLFITLDCWSRQVGQKEVQQLAGAVRGALREAELPLSGGYRLIEIRHVETGVLTVPDGLTEWAHMIFRAMVHAT